MSKLVRMMNVSLGALSNLERAKGFEPSTSTLARLQSTKRPYSFLCLSKKIVSKSLFCKRSVE